jgi:DNA-binding XRE family transcriptional regulator
MLLQHRVDAVHDDIVDLALSLAAMKAGALVARNIRRLRVAHGLSQEVLAVDAKIDRTYVSRLERGLENPSVAVVCTENLNSGVVVMESAKDGA